LAKLCMHAYVCTKFSLTKELADFKNIDSFLCKNVQKNKTSFMTGVGAKSRNYSHDAENW